MFLTHTHYDHIYDLHNLFAQHPNIRLYINAARSNALVYPMLNHSRYHLEAPAFVLNNADNIIVIKDGMSIDFYDNVTLRVIATIGHNASCST